MPKRRPYPASVASTALSWFDESILIEISQPEPVRGYLAPFPLNWAQLTWFTPPPPRARDISSVPCPTFSLPDSSMAGFVQRLSRGRTGVHQLRAQEQRRAAAVLRLRGGGLSGGHLRRGERFVRSSVRTATAVVRALSWCIFRDGALPRKWLKIAPALTVCFFCRGIGAAPQPRDAPRRIAICFFPSAASVVQQ